MDETAQKTITSLPNELGSTFKRFLSINPVLNQETVSKKLANLHSDIKNQYSLSPLPSRRQSEFLEIRSLHSVQRTINSDENKNVIVTINISGDRYETYLSTLEYFPETLLGDEHKRQAYWNPEKREYFFDRHRQSFSAILYYYQSQGRLRRPESVPVDTFLEEIAFFELDSSAAEKVRKIENIKEIKKHPMPRVLWRRYIWFYLEFPQYSMLGRIIYIISTFLTVLSCTALAVESLPDYTNRWDNICKLEQNISTNSTTKTTCLPFYTSPFFIIQTICVVYFTFEYGLRIISTPSYRKFFLSVFNWIDLAVIIPYYIFLILQLVEYDVLENTIAIYGIRLLRVLRFMRVLRLYLVFEQMKSLRVLGSTIRESLFDFLVMFTILTLFAFIFGSALYFAEQGSNVDVFDSIPKSLYWGIITITGVGYGDMTPTTAVGRVLTCFCALFGPAMMGMLVSVLVDRYQRVYNRKMYFSHDHLESIDLELLDKKCASSRSSSVISRTNKIQPVSSKSNMSSPSTLSNQSISSQKNQFSFTVSNDTASNDNVIETVATIT